MRDAKYSDIRIKTELDNSATNSLHFPHSSMHRSMDATATNAGRRHVAVCPFPFSSHPATLFLLARKIAASASDAHVSFITTQASAAALSAAFSSEQPSVQIFITDDGLARGNKADVPTPEALRVFVEVAGESLRKSMGAAEEEVGVKLSCVVADAFLSGVCREIAEEKSVKWVAVWTSAAAPLAAHIHAGELRKRIGVEGGEKHRDETVNDYITGFPSITIGDLPGSVISGNTSSPVARLLHLMRLNLRKAAAVAINTFDHLESSITAPLNAAFAGKFLTAGPYSHTLTSATNLAATDHHGCLAWLDAQRAAPNSVLYISFGTAHNPPPEEFTALAVALEAATVPFLWSLPAKFLVNLPEGFLERTGKIGKVVPWAPQMAVLSHVAVGAQLTHCGWNSVMESIVSGVPMICRPFDLAEQMLNKALVERVWGIGVAVEGGRLTEVAVTKAVERVAVGEEGRRMREKIGAMKRFAEEAAAQPGGSSCQNVNKFMSIILK